MNAKIISIIRFLLHPFLCPVYIFFYFVYGTQNSFIILNTNESIVNTGIDLNIRVLMMALINFSILPAICVLLLYKLKFITSLSLNTYKDKIIVCLSLTLFYFWGYYVLKYNYFQVNTLALRITLAWFISLILISIINKYFIVCFYSIIWSCIVFAWFIEWFKNDLSSPFIFIATILILGVVNTNELQSKKIDYSHILLSYSLSWIAVLLSNLWV